MVRPLKTLRLYISIDPIGKNPEYEKNIKNIIKYVSEKESANISMTFVDDKEFLKEYYQNDAGESTSGVSMGKAIAFQKDKRNTEKSWIKAVYMTKLRLQKLIFAESVKYDGEKFRTPDLRLVYKINQHSRADKSNVVAPRRIGLLLPG